MDDPSNSLSLPLWESSVGIIVLEALTGTRPFERDSRAAVIQAVKEGDYLCPRRISREAEDFIWRSINKDYMMRPTVRGLLEHPLTLQLTLLVGAELAVNIKDRTPAQDKNLMMQRGSSFRSAKLEPVDAPSPRSMNGSPRDAKGLAAKSRSRFNPDRAWVSHGAL